MRRRFEPLRVRPFGRLLGTYTLNDLGDSIGVVALAILVFDRTDDVAATAGFFLAAKFLPALVAAGLTAHLDRRPLRQSLPPILWLRLRRSPQSDHYSSTLPSTSEDGWYLDFPFRRTERWWSSWPAA